MVGFIFLVLVVWFLMYTGLLGAFLAFCAGVFMAIFGLIAGVFAALAGVLV
jgi:hypothetical protein